MKVYRPLIVALLYSEFDRRFGRYCAAASGGNATNRAKCEPIQYGLPNVI